MRCARRGARASIRRCHESCRRSHRDRTDEETIITAIRKTLTATAVVGAVLAGSAACGTVEQLSAGKKLDEAFEKLGKEKSISFEFGLDTDAQSLRALDTSTDPEPGDEMPDEVADLLSGAKITVTVQSKKPLDESGEKDYVGMAMKVGTKDGDLIEYRVIGDHTYIRSDIDSLGKVMGAPVPSAKDLPPGASGLKDVLEGKWVKIDMKEMERTAAEMGAEPGAKPSPEPTLDARTQQRLLEALRETIAREVDFKSAGEKDGSEHITATAPFRTLITEFFDEIRPLAKKLPPGAEMPTEKRLQGRSEHQGHGRLHARERRADRGVRRSRQAGRGRQGEEAGPGGADERGAGLPRPGADRARHGRDPGRIRRRDDGSGGRRRGGPPGGGTSPRTRRRHTPGPSRGARRTRARPLGARRPLGSGADGGQRVMRLGSVATPWARGSRTGTGDPATRVYGLVRR
ncbi:hypothetical protein SGLAM104S_10616 [Streptomyces glaucescens]